MAGERPPCPFSACPHFGLCLPLEVPAELPPWPQPPLSTEVEPRCVTARPVPSEQLPQTCTQGPSYTLLPMSARPHCSAQESSWLGCMEQHSYIQPGKTSSIHFRPFLLYLLLLPWRSCSSNELMKHAPHKHSWGSCPVYSKSSPREEENSSHLSPIEEVTKKPIKENVSKERMEARPPAPGAAVGIQENFGEHQP